ncbi:hypothetical protein NHH73_24050 [Oxalobacteraceae bacterium OTU3CINTB1]|nr:hypothetical protein NHH73_24050 [Oxalobacteraceae bacterium OTU3CINTB1]
MSSIDAVPLNTRKPRRESAGAFYASLECRTFILMQQTSKTNRWSVVINVWPSFAFIAEKSIQLVDTRKGWITFTGSPLYLHGAALMDGPPEKLGELSDYKQSSRKHELVYTYQLDGKFPHGKWLSCTYGESDQVTLARQLPDDTNACVITSRKGEHVGQNDIKIDCK